MSRQSRSRRNQLETPQTNWSLPSAAPLTPAPQPTIARAVQPTAAAPEQTASEPALEALRPVPLGHHLGGYRIFPESSSASAPPPAAPGAPPSDGGLPTVQASLRVNEPGDEYEQEADRMADLVMRSPAGPDEPLERSTGADMPSYYVQRAPSGAGLNVSPEVEGSISQMQGGGQPLPAGERSFFENRFGHDFSSIRIHADDHAAQTSRSLNARAFTVGTDIAFDSGEYQPGTESGRHLLAHELTHTIQQTGGVATKRLQRKAADEETEAATAPEETPAEQKSPVDLVAEAAQTLTEGEVAQQAVPPIEAQPIELPEHKPEDPGGSAGGGGGSGGEAAALAPQQVAPASAAAEQNAAASAKSPVAPAPAASTAAVAVEIAPAPKSAQAAPVSAPAPASVEATSAAPEAKAPTPASADKTAPEAKSPAAEAKAPSAEAQPEANAAASAQEQTEEQTEAEGAEAEAKQTGKAPGAASETAAAPGAPDAGADEASEPDDEKKRVQRMPSGRVIQRAPRSPESDPAFQAVTTSVKSSAAEQKQHVPGQQKANEASAAAKMPQEEKLGAAQNSQTTAIDAAAASQEQAAQGGAAPGFDREAFKASVKARIDQLTPKDPKQMENIEGSSVFGDVKSAVDQKVETGKDQAQGNVDDKVKEAPNPGAVPDKPVTALQANAPGQAPGQLDASGAAPKAKGPEEVEQPLQAQSQQLDTQMASAQITPEQLQTSNEPTFQAALQAKTSAQEHVAQALPQYRTKEQGQIQGAQQEAGTLAQTGLGAMFNTRSGTFGQMDTLQNTAKGSDEQKRAEIGRQIDGIFQRTKTDVEGILTALDTQVDQAFTSGADAAKQAAIDYIKRETDAYKERRYSGQDSSWGVLGGLANRVDDTFTGMPDEYFEYYRQGRDLYVAEMDKVLDKVATIVGDHLGRAHTRVQQGRDEIKKFVDSQPEELREVAQQAAQDAEGKFGELEQTINNKQQEVIDSLAQKYVEKLQALDSELEQMKEAEKGLLDKAGDMINGVIKTIGELKDLLLSTLQRAAGAVMKILQDPIGFLGNLLSAVGQGLRQFVGNIGTHLKEGLISWLTGALSAGGIQLPATWDLQGIFQLVMQILGLTYQQIRAQIVKALGPIGETVIGALEQAWEVFQIIQNEGLAGLWKFISEQVGNLQALVMDQIREMVIGQVIKAGIDWLIGILGGPAGAFVKAVQAIVRVVTWFVENAGRMASFVNSILDSVMAIASGDIGGAATAVEQSLAKALPMVISFLADLLGLGGISHKVQEIIQKVKAPIQKGIDWLVQKAVALGKKLWGMLGLGRTNAEGSGSVEAGLAALREEEHQYLTSKGEITEENAQKVAESTQKKQSKIFRSITVIDRGDAWEYAYVARMAKNQTPKIKLDPQDLQSRLPKTFTKEDAAKIIGETSTTGKIRYWFEKWLDEGVLFETDDHGVYTFDASLKRRSTDDIITEIQKNLSGKWFTPQTLIDENIIRADLRTAQRFIKENSSENGPIFYFRDQYTVNQSMIPKQLEGDIDPELADIIDIHTGQILPEISIRDRFYKKHHVSSVETAVWNNADAGRVDKNGNKLYHCQIRPGERQGRNHQPLITRDQGEVDHILQVSEHWNDGDGGNPGRNMTQEERNDWYDKISNLRVLCSSCNESRPKTSCDRTVGPNFRPSSGKSRRGQ